MHFLFDIARATYDILEESTSVLSILEHCPKEPSTADAGGFYEVQNNSFHLQASILLISLVVGACLWRFE